MSERERMLQGLDLSQYVEVFVRQEAHLAVARWLGDADFAALGRPSEIEQVSQRMRDQGARERGLAHRTWPARASAGARTSASAPASRSPAACSQGRAASNLSTASAGGSTSVFETA
jgi:hypothetical protein